MPIPSKARVERPLEMPESGDQVEAEEIDTSEARYGFVSTGVFGCTPPGGALVCGGNIGGGPPGAPGIPGDGKDGPVDGVAGAGAGVGGSDNVGVGVGVVTAGTNGTCAPPPIKPDPILVSVPDANSAISACGRMIFLIILGVMSSTISVLTLLSSRLENRRPTTGMSDRPGTLLVARRSSF